MKKYFFFLFCSFLNYPIAFAQITMWKTINNSFINYKGEVGLKTNYYYVSDFHEGLAVFCEDTAMRKCGCVNTTGKIIFNNKIDLFPFSDGLAASFKKNKWFPIFNNSYKSCESCNIKYMFEKGRLVFLNKRGKKKFTFRYEPYIFGPTYPLSQTPFFSEGLAAINIVKRDTSQWHNTIFIDKRGKRVFNKSFLGAGNFYDGLAFVILLNGDRGYISKTNQLVIKLDNSTAGATHFSEGFAVISDTSNSDYFINKKGEKLGNLLFNSAESFSDGMARIEKNGKYGYIDTSGKIVIEPIYWAAQDFSDGIAVVTQYIQNSKGYLCNTFLIDKKGIKVSPDLGNSHIEKFKGGLAHGTQASGDKTIIEFYINISGKMVWWNNHVKSDL
jgi:hypothetical protein